MTSQEEVIVCVDCVRKSKSRKMCSWCGKTNLVFGSEGEELLRQEDERLKWLKTNQERIENLKVVTVSRLSGYLVTEEIGLVSGSSSKAIIVGAIKQHIRLEGALDIALFNLKSEAAMLGADAVIGVNLAVGNSSGSALNLATSSDAVMLIGTAVKIEKN